MVEGTIPAPAWSELEGLRPVLRGYLARRCRDASEVDDVVQETLIRAARYRASLLDPERLRSWVLVIASNAFHDHVRRQTRMRFRELGEEALENLIGEGTPPPVDGEGEEEMRIGPILIGKDTLLRQLVLARRELRENDQRVLDAYYGGSGSCRETAVACGLPRALVKVRLFRARQRLLRTMRRRLTGLEVAGAGCRA